MSVRNKNRVVFIVPIFPQRSETFVANKFAGLLKKGWDLHVVCDRSPRSDWDRYPQLHGRPDLLRYVHVNWPSHPRWMEVLLFPIAFLKCAIANISAVLWYLGPGLKQFGLKTLHKLYLDSHLIALKPDVIHFEFGNLAKNRTYLRKALECDLSASFRGHELNFVGLDDPNYYNEIWKQVDILHFVSKDLLQRARLRGFDCKKPSFLIPDSVDSTYFSPPHREMHTQAGTPKRPLRILSVGRLYWTKGHEHGLQAIRTLIDQGIDCECRIIGDGSHRTAVLFAIQDLGLENYVKLLYWQPPSQVKAQMEWADVFLHPSVSEGFGVVVLEAQAMGLPVVCTDADGLKENVADGETGFVVPRRNPQALAEKLSLLSRDSNLRTKMGEMGRKRVMTHFAVENEIVAFDRYLQSALHLSDTNEISSNEHSAAFIRG